MKHEQTTLPNPTDGKTVLREKLLKSQIQIGVELVRKGDDRECVIFQVHRRDRRVSLHRPDDRPHACWSEPFKDLLTRYLRVVQTDNHDNDRNDD